MVVMNTQLNTPTQILYTVDFKNAQNNSAQRSYTAQYQPALLH